MHYNALPYVLGYMFLHPPFRRAVCRHVEATKILSPIKSCPVGTWTCSDCIFNLPTCVNTQDRKRGWACTKTTVHKRKVGSKRPSALEHPPKGRDTTWFVRSGNTNPDTNLGFGETLGWRGRVGFMWVMEVGPPVPALSPQKKGLWSVDRERHGAEGLCTLPFPRDNCLDILFWWRLRRNPGGSEEVSMVRYYCIVIAGWG